MDDQAHSDHTLRLVTLLIAADKDIELLIVPGAEHRFIDCLHDARKRAWDFLVRELMDTQPPAYRPHPLSTPSCSASSSPERDTRDEGTMKTQSPPVITRTYGVHQLPVILGKVLRRVAVPALAAALLAGAAAPGAAAADSGAVTKAAAGQDRPELQKAMQAFVDAGFAGVQLRVHDQRGEWVAKIRSPLISRRSPLLDAMAWTSYAEKQRLGASTRIRSSFNIIPGGALTHC